MRHDPAACRHRRFGCIVGNLFAGETSLDLEMVTAG